MKWSLFLAPLTLSDMIKSLLLKEKESGQFVWFWCVCSIVEALFSNLWEWHIYIIYTLEGHWPYSPKSHCRHAVEEAVPLSRPAWHPLPPPPTCGPLTGSSNLFLLQFNQLSLIVCTPSGSFFCSVEILFLVFSFLFCVGGFSLTMSSSLRTSPEVQYFVPHGTTCALVV